MRPAWINVDLGAISENVRQIQRVTGKSIKIAAVIKQFAYGHGLLPVARKLYGAGIDFLAVGSLEEAIALRDDGYQGRILFLSAANPDSVSYFFNYKITPAVTDEAFVHALNSFGKKNSRSIPVHVKIDTGMGRLGFYPDQVKTFLAKIKDLKFVSLEGIFTHFPVADTDSNFTAGQLKIFQDLISQLKNQNIYFKYCHCANSLGVANYPDSHFNMIRPGLILYGVKPAQKVKIKLKPALSLKSKVIFIKDVSRGTTVGYGREFTAKSKTRIATVSIGYADGYPWSLSGRSKVLINGKFFNLAGRVCMDHIMVDIGSTNQVRVGDTVTLIGKDKKNQIKAEDLASWAGTIPYEITTCLSRDLPRHYSNPD